MNEVYVTLDIDWAPDHAIEAAADILESAGCAATWFVTHETPLLDRLRDRSDLFELGIHPNFLAGSSHGSDPEEVLATVLALVPEARSMRTHSGYISEPLIRLLYETQLELDSSTFMPAMPHASAVRHGEGERSIWRIPYWWCDDYEAGMSTPRWNVDDRFRAPGVKVLTFHPIHVALNLARLDTYVQLKHSKPDVATWSADDVAANRHDGAGTATMLATVAKENAASSAMLGGLVPAT